MRVVRLESIADSLEEWELQRRTLVRRETDERANNHHPANCVCRKCFEAWRENEPGPSWGLIR